MKITPFMYACGGGHVKIAKFLVKHGAKTDTKCSWGANTLFYTAEMGSYSVLKYLVEELGMDISQKNELGDTLLITTCKGYPTNINFVKYIAPKVDVRARNKWGRTALYYSVSNLSIFLYLLLNYNLNINEPCDAGETPLIAAAEDRDNTTLRYLVNLGANVNARSKYGVTALAQTILHEKFSETKLLLKKGADINFEDSNGLTCFIYACRYGSSKMLKLVLKQCCVE